MRIEAGRPGPMFVELGSLSGGECFRVAPGGAIYIRLSGATGRLQVPPDRKVGITLTHGTIGIFPADKRVQRVPMVAREDEEARDGR